MRINKSISYLSLFFTLPIVVFLWDKIEIPYDNNNLIFGDNFINNYNHLNDQLRFIFFLGFPLIVFFIAYINFNDTFSVKINSKNFFLINDKNLIHKDKRLNQIFYIILIFLIVEFLSLDFYQFTTYKLDYFHEGTYLVPPINFIETNKFWSSTLYDYGFILNNISLILWKIIGFQSIGSSRLTFLLLIFLNKLLLLLISKNICKTLIFNKNINCIFFILLSIGIIQLVSYGEFFHYSFFSPRSFLFLFFFYLITKIVVTENTSIYLCSIVGSLSCLSFFWTFDIAIYINLFILIFAFILLLQKKFLDIFIIFLGTLFSWILFFAIIPNEILSVFFNDVHFIISISPHLLSLKYPSPFEVNSFRFTEPLISFIIIGLLTIIINFNKKIKINYNTKIIINLLFLASIIIFNSSLQRSDLGHIIYVSGFRYFIFYLNVLIIFFHLINEKKIIFVNIINKNIVIIFIGIFLCLVTIFPFNLKNSYNVKIFNSFKIFNNLNYLIKADDEMYLKNIKNYSSLVKYYKKLTINDKCIQVLGADVSMPYLLRKPSCSKIYIGAHIITNWTEEKFINDINKAKPSFLLYGRKDDYSSNNKNSILFVENRAYAEKFIFENYFLYENFNGWLIYKNKNL